MIDKILLGSMALVSILAFLFILRSINAYLVILFSIVIGIYLISEAVKFVYEILIKEEVENGK